MKIMDKLRQDIASFLAKNTHVKPTTLSLRSGNSGATIGNILKGSDCTAVTMDRIYAAMRIIPTEDRALRGHLPPEEIVARKGGA